jgi:hypothetical protein
MKKKISIKIDERSLMILKEISSKRKVSLSVIVRAFLKRSVDGLIDEKGNVMCNEKEESEE